MSKFLKGHKGFWLGKKLSKEIRHKMSLAQKGKIPHNKGKKTDEEVKQKMSESHRGLNTWSKGKKLSEETKKKMSESRRGEKHPLWIKDRTQLKKSEKKWKNSAYQYWVKSVKKIDNWKCKINNSDCKGQLEAHHILNWEDHPELRYEINNGITLCHAHHPRGRKREAELSPYLQILVAGRN